MTKAKCGMSSIGTVCTFFKVGTCSETLCNVINRAFDNPLELEENAVMPLAGGIMQHGYQCGQLWGAALAAGAQAYRLFGTGPEAETAAITAAQRVVESFRAMNKEINCFELTDTDMESLWETIKFFLLKGGTIRCFYMAAKYAPVAFKEINDALSEKPVAPPTPQVSCASMLAEKIGASDMHRVMAAGLAGGIGLSGSGCGALGAAVWFIKMESLREGESKNSFKNPKIDAVIEKFLKSSDFEFNCSEIVGRKFENADDHASYVCNGGCSEIIETLAGSLKNNCTEDLMSA